MSSHSFTISKISLSLHCFIILYNSSLPKIPIFRSCSFCASLTTLNTPGHPDLDIDPDRFDWDVKIVISCNVLFCSIILIPTNANYLVGKVEQIGCPIFFSLFYQLHGCQLAQVPLKHHHLWLRKDWKVFFFYCSLCHLPQFNNSFWCQFFQACASDDVTCGNDWTIL